MSSVTTNGIVKIDGVDYIESVWRTGDTVEIRHEPRWRTGQHWQCDADTTKGHQCQNYRRYVWSSRNGDKPQFCRKHSDLRSSGRDVSIHPLAFCRKGQS